MNLQDLNSGTPSTKQWLNPVVGTLTVGNVFTTPPYTEILVTPATLTAAQLVNAIIYVAPSTNNVTNLPTATELKTYFGSQLVNGLAFTVNININGTMTLMTFNLGAGTSTPSGGGTLLMGSSQGEVGIFSAILTYQWLNSDWTVYSTPKIG